MKGSSALKLLIASCLLAAGARAAFAELRSPFPSDVPGLSVPNAHKLGDGGPGLVLRGSAPRWEEILQLKNYGITDMIIFKKGEKDKVPREMKLLRKAGYSKRHIRYIPFPWKEMGAFRPNCEMTVQTLRLLREIRDTPKKGVYFHCTVGEDRTGYLSGLFRMLTEGWDIEKAFRRELCQNGYGDGNNITKPVWVSTTVAAGLTPTFVKMARLVSSGTLTWSGLDVSACAVEPVIDTTTLAGFHCR